MRFFCLDNKVDNRRGQGFLTHRNLNVKIGVLLTGGGGGGEGITVDEMFVVT